jgi:predicted RNA methylase
MFKANRFLDVGCSKGFFALKAAKESSSVLAIDPDEEALKSWESVCPKNVTQKVGTFKDVSGEFDMVWIGNGHHYLYREDRNYVDRLKRIATDRVLIEGPTGPKRFEMRNFGPHQTEVELLESMQDFYLVRRAESETKGRAVWLFKTRS